MAYYSQKDDISYTPLTAEQEKALFDTYYHSKGKKSLAARDEIIRHHLKLVAKLSITCSKRALDDDLSISAGNMGLMQALHNRKFDPSRGLRFSTYLRAFVRGQVYAAMSANHLAFRTANSEESFFSVGYVPEGAAITGQKGRSAPLDGILSTPHQMRTGEAPAEFFVDHAYEAAELNERRRAALLKAIARLPKPEAIAVELVELDGLTFDQVGKLQNPKRSRQAIQQAHARGIKKLYAMLSPLRKELV